MDKNDSSSVNITNTGMLLELLPCLAMPMPHVCLDNLFCYAQPPVPEHTIKAF